MTNELQSLDSILEAELETEEATEVVEQTPEPKVEEVVEEESKGETEEAQADDETEPPSEKEQKLVPIETVLDERRKRKDLEEELKQYKQSEPDENAPDPVEDPEGYKNYVRAEVQAEERATRITDSRDKMLLEADDYESKEKAFLVLASQDKSLVEEMNNHPNPAKFAYEKASEYIASLAPKAEVVETPAEPSKEEKRKTSAVKVQNLTNASGAGSNNASIVTPLTLDDALPD